MPKPIKILYLIGSFRNGGKERQVSELINNLPEKDYSIHLIVKSLGVPYLPKLQKKLKSFVCLEKEHFGFRDAVFILACILKWRPHVVHSWCEATTLFSLVARLVTLNAFPLVEGSLRNSFEQRRSLGSSLSKLLRFFFSSVVVANSKAALSEFEVPHHKALCIHNGFDFRRLHALPPKEEILNSFDISTPWVVGMVARFYPQKDWEGFLAVAERVLDSRNDVTFLGIGEGPDLEKIKQAVSEKHRFHIRFLGMQHPVESLIQCFDIGLLITNPKWHREGISNFLMECMAMGKPVVALRDGGTPEIVDDGETGFLIPPETDAPLPGKNRHFAGFSGAPGNYGEKAAHQKIRTHFSVEKMTRAFDSLYRQLISKTSPSPS